MVSRWVSQATRPAPAKIKKTAMVTVQSMRKPQALSRTEWILHANGPRRLGGRVFCVAGGEIEVDPRLIRKVVALRFGAIAALA